MTVNPTAYRDEATNDSAEKCPDFQGYKSEFRKTSCNW